MFSAFRTDDLPAERVGLFRCGFVFIFIRPAFYLSLYPLKSLKADNRFMRIVDHILCFFSAVLQFLFGDVILTVEPL